MASGSVTHWIVLLQAGDLNAAQPLWERYFQRLVALARLRLRGAPRACADEEDVVLSVLDSFIRAVQRGDYPLLNDRDDLWQMLVVRTAHKAVSLIRHERAKKRGGHCRADVSVEELQQVLADEPTPDFAAQMNEECQRLLALLPNESLRELARWKMEGFTLAEIAKRRNCVQRTVKRQLQVIRSYWKHEGRP